MAGGTPQAATEVRANTAEQLEHRLLELTAEVRRLQLESEELARDLQYAEDALCDQELYTLGGYLVSVWPTGKGEFVATCPTLHASVQAASREAAVESLKDAVGAVARAFWGMGRSLPPKDAETRCLD